MSWQKSNMEEFLDGWKKQTSAKIASQYNVKLEQVQVDAFWIQDFFVIKVFLYPKGTRIFFKKMTMAELFSSLVGLDFP